MSMGEGEAVADKNVYECVRSFFPLHIQYGARLKIGDAFTVGNAAWEQLEEFYEREKTQKISLQKLIVLFS